MRPQPVRGIVVGRHAEGLVSVVVEAGVLARW
jgi:hypothetical protein